MKKNEGFLLLELMVGISVLSIGLLLIMDSLMRSMAAVKISEDLFRAGLLLEENIYDAYNADRSEGASEGVLQGGQGTNFCWRTEIKRVEKDSLDEATFNIFSNRKKFGVDLTVVTYL